MRLDKILLTAIAAIFTAHTLATVLSWYTLYPWVDIPMHIAGGLWIGLLFAYLFFERLHVLPSSLRFLELLFLGLGFVALIGVSWEIYEYLSEVFVLRLMPFGGSLPGIHFDTIKDLFDDLAGGFLSVVWYYFFRLKVGGGKGV